jgi:beta-galactosidase
MIQPLTDNWRFVQDNSLTDDEALESTAADWQTVSLPHTWNAEDAASLDAEDYKRGLGWYRLEFATPTVGVRHWLEVGAASLVADVWLNGQKLGQHRGGFTQFRFDVTDRLGSPTAGRPARSSASPSTTTPSSSCSRTPTPCTTWLSARSAPATRGRF